jgi:class 3 adenylate cyclase
MSFLDTILRAKAYLQQQGGVSLRALRREFALDQDALEELVEELVDIQHVAARDGKALNWVGATTPHVHDDRVAPIAVAAIESEATTAPAGERRQLTVLFCNLVGSTPLSQQLDAEEWRDLIAHYQQAASGAVARFGGHIAKNLGDGLLIYFGWPTAREDDPERAVRAGLAIVEAVRALNEGLLPSPPPLPEMATEEGTRIPPPMPREWVPSSANISVSGGGSGRKPLLSVRVGMHTGPVVIADGGDVFGETANVAARVQDAAAPDRAVITAATQRLAAGMFVVEDRGPQMLKGVREPGGRVSR